MDYKVIFSGLVVGALAVTLTALGNPPNMGYCIACFLRDIAGSLGLHRAAAVQYIRPEITGLGIGAFLISLKNREFRARGGANPLMRFVLGFAIMVGALAFLGCPLRLVLRLGGGDINAITGLIGFIAGIWVGIIAIKGGFNPGRAQSQSKGTGYIYPIFLVAIFVALMVRPDFLFFSEAGPGSMTAPILAALAAGLAIGIMAQRSRLCMVGGIRDIILIRDPHLLWGFVAIFAVTLGGNLILGEFNLGFSDQIAHSAHLWNFLGMVVVGFGAILAGGCPLRQLVMAGEGDTDATVTVIGMIVGAAFVHNFGLAGVPGVGLPSAGQIAVVLCLAALAFIGFGHRFGAKSSSALKEVA